MNLLVPPSISTLCLKKFISCRSCILDKKSERNANSKENVFMQPTDSIHLILH